MNPLSLFSSEKVSTKLAGLPELAEPMPHPLRIGRKDDMCESGQLRQRPRVVDEWVMDRISLDAEIERIGIVMIENQLAVDHQFVGPLSEVDQRDAVAVDVGASSESRGPAGW